MNLLHDIARCPGWGDGPEDWLMECNDCQRRTAPPGWQSMQPPQIITFWCEDYIPPDPPEVLRLRQLAQEQGLAS